MNSTETHEQLKGVARATGLIYLVLFAAGIFAHFFVRGMLIVPGDPAMTASNLGASEALFRLGMGADLLMILCDVALALLFYRLLRPVSEPLALAAAFFRLIQAATLAMNLINLYLGLELSGADGYLGVLGIQQAQTLGLLFLAAHDVGYTLGLTFFGLNLAIIAYLIYRAEFLPTTLGVLIGVAALGYLTDSFARVLLTDYELYAAIFESVVFTPAFVAELALALYLVVRGVRPAGAPIPEVAPAQ